MTRRRSSILPAFVGALIILAFVAVVGRPNVFTDTRDYMIHGARFYQAVRRTVLGEKPPAPRTPVEEQKWQRLQRQMHFDHSNVGARSPYYGIFLYTLAHRGTLWLLTVAQGLCAAWVMFLLWRSIAPAAPGWTYYALMAALSAGASLPWVAAFAVPDIFAAVLVIAITLLLFYRPMMARWEVIGTWLLLLVSIAFHGSHGPLALGLLIAGLGLASLMKADGRSKKAFAGLVLAAVAIATLAGWTYGAAVKWKTGDELRRPPFLMARVLADGPGKAYLRYSCAHGVRWAICRFKDVQMDTSDHILWSVIPTLGIFNRASYDERVAMEKQELSFVIGAFAYDPVGQIEASIENWGEQLGSFEVDDPLRRPMVFLLHSYWGRTNLVGLIRGVGDCGVRGEACAPKISISQLAAVDGAVAFVALGLLIWGLFQRRTLGMFLRKQASWERPLDRATAATLLIVVAIVINAAICGMLSCPFPRYQSRVVWLLPAMSMLLAMALVPAALWDRWRLRVPVIWLETGQALQARAQVLQALAMARLDPTFLRYAVVGFIGFSVDTLVVRLMIDVAGLDYFAGRLISFSVAVGVTWMLNRAWTFRHAGSDAGVRRAAVYVGVQVAGGVLNITAYNLAILAAPLLQHGAWIVIPEALGSAAGLCLTFLGAKHLAFRTRRPPLQAAADTPAA